MPSSITPLRLVLAALLGAAAILAAVLIAGGGDSSSSHPVASSGCPAGTTRVTERVAEELVHGRAQPAGGRVEEGDEGEGTEAKVERLMHKLKCAPAKTPEPVRDLTTISTAQAARVGQDAPGAYGAAVKQSDKLSTTPGGGANWTPVGTTPLISDDPTFGDTFGGGFSRLAGRISDFAYDAAHKQLYAAVASGGVWASGNLGSSWRSIGDTLPLQQVGSVAYTTAHGGTILALTGDNAFGGYTYAGEGVYRSTDGGRSWVRSSGVPRGGDGLQDRRRPDQPERRLRGQRPRALPLDGRRRLLCQRQPADRPLRGQDDGRPLLPGQRRHRRRRPGQGQVRPQRRRRRSPSSAGARAPSRTATARPRRPRTASTRRPPGRRGPSRTSTRTPPASRRRTPSAASNSAPRPDPTRTTATSTPSSRTRSSSTPARSRASTRAAWTAIRSGSASTPRPRRPTSTAST